MPRVHVEVGHYLARQVGAQAPQVPWQGEVEISDRERVVDLMAKLAERDGRFRDSIFDGQQLRSGVLLLINGRLRSWRNVAELELRDGDRLSLYPMIGGG